VRPDEGGNQHALREALRECTRDHHDHLMREAISMHSENGPSVSRRAPPDEGHNQHALRGARPTCALARAASAEPAFWVRLDKMIAC